MELEDILPEFVRDRRHERGLERPGRDDNLIGRITAALDLDQVAVLGRRIERTLLPSTGVRRVPGVLGEIAHHFVTAGVASGSPGKADPAGCCSEPA